MNVWVHLNFFWLETLTLQNFVLTLSRLTHAEQFWIQINGWAHLDFRWLANFC